MAPPDKRYQPSHLAQYEMKVLHRIVGKLAPKDRKAFNSILPLLNQDNKSYAPLLVAKAVEKARFCLNFETERVKSEHRAHAQPAPEAPQAQKQQPETQMPGQAGKNAGPDELAQISQAIDKVYSLALGKCGRLSHLIPRLELASHIFNTMSSYLGGKMEVLKEAMRRAEEDKSVALQLRNQDFAYLDELSTKRSKPRFWTHIGGITSALGVTFASFYADIVKAAEKIIPQFPPGAVIAAGIIVAAAGAMLTGWAIDGFVLLRKKQVIRRTERKLKRIEAELAAKVSQHFSNIANVAQMLVERKFDEAVKEMVNWASASERTDRTPVQ